MVGVWLRKSRFTLCAALFMFLSGNFLVAQDGIYADFTTSMGNFTCKLEYGIAPKAAANFIGLATGQRAWLDLPSGVARTNPFYNGLLFHRVVANFVIQAGSPNGQGSDGPGYIVPDEISAALRFNNPYMLAMANTGTNSNGSQFFVTVASTPGLNDGYTIFGELTTGTNVVVGISKVATNATSHPLTNVVIQNVAIRRVGTAAQAFDINAQNLPVVTNVPAKIANNGTAVSLTFSNNLYADNRIYLSTNLNNWSGQLLGIETALPVANTLIGSKSAPLQFYSLAQIKYSSSTFAPKTLLNRTLILNVNNFGVITNNFDALGGGTYFFNGTTNSSQGTVNYSWNQQPYRGDLSPIVYSGSMPFMVLRLNFSGAGGGSFGGTAYPVSSGAFAVSGSFNLN